MGTLNDFSPQGKPITKSGVRILRPGEYALLRQASFRPVWYGCRGSEGTALLDGCLYTGMRYVELQRLQKHKDWFDGQFIFLPKESLGKAKRKQLERYVRLNPQGRKAVEAFLAADTMLPSWWTWADALRRWAADAHIDPTGLGPKTMRKTWESWLMTAYPNHWPQILLSQGHTASTSINHYLNMPFLEADKEAMKPYVDGWA